MDILRRTCDKFCMRILNFILNLIIVNLISILPKKITSCDYYYYLKKTLCNKSNSLGGQSVRVTESNIWPEKEATLKLAWSPTVAKPWGTNLGATLVCRGGCFYVYIIRKKFLSLKNGQNEIVVGLRCGRRSIEYLAAFWLLGFQNFFLCLG